MVFGSAGGDARAAPRYAPFTDFVKKSFLLFCGLLQKKLFSGLALFRRIQIEQ